MEGVAGHWKLKIIMEQPLDRDAIKPIRKSTKKFFLSGRATKRGGGLTGVPLRKKNTLL